MSTDPELEQRMVKLEERLAKFDEFDDLMAEIKETLASIRLPSTALNRLLTKKMEKEHHLTWGKLRTDTEFAAKFQNASKFYYHADLMAKTWGWKIETIERRLYYYDDSFDIEAVRKTAEWRRYKANDPKLSALLVRKVILPAEGPVNILDHLRGAYPDRAYPWCNEAIDSLAAYIKRWGYHIDRSDQNPDIFSKTERGESG